MAKTIKVRWNGDKQDPDSITQYGITFPKGEWVDVPHDEEAYKTYQEARGIGFNRTAKLAGNRFFEVKGHEQAPVEAPAQPAPAALTPVRAPSTTYRVQGSKKEGFFVVDDKGNVIEEDKGPFKSEADAQNVADALNAPKP